MLLLFLLIHNIGSRLIISIDFIIQLVPITKIPNKIYFISTCRTHTQGSRPLGSKCKECFGLKLKNCTVKLSLVNLLVPGNSLVIGKIVVLKKKLIGSCRLSSGVGGFLLFFFLAHFKSILLLLDANLITDIKKPSWMLITSIISCHHLVIPITTHTIIISPILQLPVPFSLQTCIPQY